MSTSSNEGIIKSAAPIEDDEEEKTETNNDVVVAGETKGEGLLEKSKLRDCCKHYDKLLAARPEAKVSDRDALITTLQNQLKNMEDQYKKTLGEQQDIKKKYAETVQRLSKAEVSPKVEFSQNQMVEATDESTQIDDLRKEISHRLETGRIKPKKCCRYLYEALGVEIPDKKLNKKAAGKPANVDSKPGDKKEDEIEESKQEVSGDLHKTGGRNENAPKIKERKSLECRETCKTFFGEVPTEKSGLRKELSSQVAMMELQEKDLNDLQDKLRKLSQSLESFERTKVTTPPKGYASLPPQKTTVVDSKEATSNLKSGESTEKLEAEEAKPDRKEPPPKKRSSRCCKRSLSQENRKKDKPPQKEPAAPSEIPPEPIESHSKNEAAPKITIKELPCYDKCVNREGKLQAPPEKEVLEKSATSPPPQKTTVVDSKEATSNLKKSGESTEKLEAEEAKPDRKEPPPKKRSSRCCKRSLSQENRKKDKPPQKEPAAPSDLGGDKSEENCDCGIQKCPVKKGYEEEATCCDLDDCPSHRGLSWGANKSQEITCCDLESCPKLSKRDAHTSTCDEICPYSNKSPTKENKDDDAKKKKNLTDAYEKALEANKDLGMRIQSQMSAAARKDEEIEDLQNQLKEIILKNQILLCEFGCKLDELKAGYESAQGELDRLKENRAALNVNVEKLKAEYDVALQEKENEAKQLRNKLEAKGTEEAELQQKANSDCRALRICESKFNELKSEYEYYKEKAAVSENQNALLRQEIADLKETLAKVGDENEVLQSCKLECDKMKDQCFQECKKLKEDSQRRTSELDEIRQEKDNLVRENSQHISGLENRILNLSMEGMAMQETNARLSQELEQARDGLRNMRHSLGGLAEEKTGLEDELAERQEEVRQLEEALQRKSEELEEMVKTENVYKVQVCNLECTLEEQKCCFEDALNKLQAAKEDNNRLNRDLERMEGEYASLDGGLETWKRKYEEDVGALQKHLGETQEELARAEDKLKESEEQLKNAVCDYECKLFELINKYNISQRELQDHQECRDMLEGKLATSVGKLEKVKLEMAECMKECQEEKGEKVKLRRQLDQSLIDFHEKDRSLEETLRELEQAKQEKIYVENNLKLTICSYECKIEELVAAQESSASELLSLKQEVERAAQETQQLKTDLAGQDELKSTIAALRKELEDLKAADKNNASKLEEAQAEIQRLNETKAAKQEPTSVGSAEKKKENEVQTEPSQFKTKCISECKKRCAVKPDPSTQRTRREECRKACGASKKPPGPADSQNQIKRPPSQTAEPVTEKADKKLLCKTDQSLNKECRDLCAELHSIKKMLSDIEIVSIPKPTMIMEESESQLVSVVSAPKLANGESVAMVTNGEKAAVKKTHSWKEEYEKTAQERDELKQEISHMYNKLKEVMKELEDKLNV